MRLLLPLLFLLSFALPLGAITVAGGKSADVLLAKLNNKLHKELYSDVRFLRTDVPGDYEAVRLLQSGGADFALVRGDILHMLSKGKGGFPPYEAFGILAAVGERHILYATGENSLYDLRGKRVATGEVSDLAQVYLRHAARKAGIGGIIQYKALPSDQAYEALEKKGVDAAFLVVPQRMLSAYADADLPVRSLPKELSDPVRELGAWEDTVVSFKTKKVNTFKTPLFLVASSDLPQEKSEPMVYALAQLGIDPTQKPNPAYGPLFPGAGDILQNALEKEQAYKASLVQQAKDQAAKEEEARKKAEEEAKRKAEEAKRKAEEAARKKPFVITLVDVHGQGSKQILYYTVTSQLEKPATLLYQGIVTDDLDIYPIKPRHLFTAVPETFTLEPGKTKILALTYHNIFGTLPPISGEIVLREREEERYHKAPLSVSEEAATQEPEAAQ